MSSAQEVRINDALASLVRSLLPAFEDEDDDQWDARHAEALQQAKGILNAHTGHVEFRDVNHVSDLIKKKLWREHDSPDKAVKYGNLYSRLLTSPILSNKWGILTLLHQLSEPGSEEAVPGSQPPRKPAAHSEQSGRSSRLAAAQSKGKEARDRVAAGLNDASSSARASQLHAGGADANVKASTEAIQTPGRQTRDRQDEEQAEPLAARSQAPSEAALLRDLPFTLQGLSSTHLTFASQAALTLPSNLPLPLISLLHTLAEPSLLYRNLSEFVSSRDEGLIGQSLRAVIGVELRSYLVLIGTLEGEIRRAIAGTGDGEDDSGVRKAGVTLKRCVIWTREATMGLRLMSLMADESKSKKGGQLISMVHSFSTSYGDPFVSAFAERMLLHLTRPFYDMLRQWIYDGELSDPYQEFFVFESDSDDQTKDPDPRRVPAASVWESKYKLKQQLVPTIITEDFARKVFLIGKSLNFIRCSCGDSSWVEAYSKEASKELRYGDTATLEMSIDKAYKTTMARLINLMSGKFNLFEHLNALKKYLLLGQGDFIALLMESLASNLDRPAGSQYRHTLTAQLEYAIRGSNAQFDLPDVLRRLDARLLELTTGDIGWDVFTLEYKVDAPVDVVITSWASKQYLVVFNFLWRIKRVEFALGSIWRRFMTGARTVLASVNDTLGRDWKVARCCVAEMIHFINQLQYYILFEVIEASWDQLQAAVTKPDCTLDDLIDAHTKYLKAITHKGLLGSTKSIITGTREDSFTSQLHYILKVMLGYKDAVDGLYSFSVAEFNRRQLLAARIETRTAAGQWGVQDRDEDGLDSPLPGQQQQQQRLRARTPDGDAETPAPVLPGLGPVGDDHMLPALRKRLEELSTDFRSRLATLLGDLLVQPDVDLKFLGVVMNFNDVYRPHRRRRRDPARDGEGERARERGTARGAERDRQGAAST